MNQETIAQTLSHLLQSNENEIIEFKEAKNDFDFTKLGRYFSALSNEANLKERNNAWLIFGVNDKKEIVGTHYRPTQKSLDSLKEELSKRTINNITFIDIHEVFHQGERVLLFEIPATPRGIPMSFDGHYYGRNGESLSPLNIEEIERIRKQSSIIEDWTAVIVPEATLKDLDEEALKIAREKFKEKQAMQDGAPSPIFMTKYRLGIKTIHTFISAAREGRIGLQDAARLMNLPVNRFEQVMR